MTTIVIASRNTHKVREIRRVLKMPGVRICGLDDFPGLGYIPETGNTYMRNATIKAKRVARHTGFWSLADDSGIEVDYLGGRPAVRSARFAGREGDDKANNAKMLRVLRKCPFEKRRARYRCVLVLMSPEGRMYAAEGVCRGYIAQKPVGKRGFGYDPLFYYPAFRKTFGQISAARKNRVSHRGIALEKMKSVIKSLRVPCAKPPRRGRDEAIRHSHCEGR